ncbi:Exportin [Brachionus plicatilis]|uniref:Exportin-T n=1 Tax=Brachionus plicatilis TaxID=10195 RepID=A0A3M7S5Z7_BRAPC|nr:Exportin [Brachionus plicatilis]
MPLLNQVMIKYKQQIVPFMQSILMQLTDAVLNFVNSLPTQIASQILRISTSQIQQYNLQQPLNIQSILPHVQTYLVQDENSEITPDTQLVLDIQFMYKSYFQFLLNVVNNDLMDIIAMQQTNDIYKIYFTLLQGAQQGQPDTSKSCFQCIRKFINFFVNKPDMGNFVNYTIENVVPCCMDMLFNQAIDLNDAQQVLVLNELAQCLIMLYNKFGDEFIKYLEMSCLPSFNLSPQVIQELFQVIKSNNPKGLKTVKEMIQPKTKK